MTGVGRVRSIGGVGTGEGWGLEVGGGGGGGKYTCSCYCKKLQCCPVYSNYMPVV